MGPEAPTTTREEIDLTQQRPRSAEHVDATAHAGADQALEAPDALENQENRITRISHAIGEKATAAGHSIKEGLTTIAEKGKHVLATPEHRKKVIVGGTMILAGAGIARNRMQK